MSHPARGAWIEIARFGLFIHRTASHPARGAWIEMLPPIFQTLASNVAPRKGCVD